MPAYNILLVKSIHEDEVEYHWTAPNGRQFEVRELGQGYFLSERRPSPAGTFFEDGQMVLQGDLVDRLSELAKTASPSDYYANLPPEVPREMLCLIGSGIGVGAIFYPTLKDAKGAIHAALDADTWYDSHRPAPAAEVDEEAAALENARESARYWQEIRQALDIKPRGAPEAFRGLSNMFGPLDKEHRDRLMAFRNAPSAATWEDVHSMIVLGGATMWQIWTDRDSTAPRSKPLGAPWTRWPEPEELFDMLKEARLERIEVAERRLAQARLTIARIAREKSREGSVLDRV